MNHKFRKKFTSPILLRYLEAYEKNPQAKVFAPLAEAYRKVGLVEEALEILKKGIRVHPNYEMAHFCLGMCYYDLEKYELCFRTLDPLVKKNIDNLAMQRAFGEVCERTGRKDEALTSYKYVLFANPRDEWAKEKVRTLEGENDRERLQEVPRQQARSEVVQVDALENDHWVEMNLGPLKGEEEGIGPSTSAEVLELDRTPEPQETKEWEGFQELNVAVTVEESKEVLFEEFKSAPPLVTHTLVDLYCAQGHHLKAVEILEKILELNPHDDRTSERLRELKEIVLNVSPNQQIPAPQTEGPQRNLEAKYVSFLNRIKNQAKIHLSAFTLPSS